MIANFRKSLRSWATVGLLLIALIAIVVTGFGTGGFGGLGSLTKGNGANGADRLATAEGRAITGDEVREYVNRAFQRARAQQPNLELSAFLAQGAFEAVLNQLISDQAVRGFAERQGLRVSTTMIDQQIANAPIFRNLAGQFDQATYRQQLAQLRMSESQLRDELALQSYRRMLVGPVALGARSPEGVAREYANLLLERRQGVVAVVPNQLVAASINPTDAEIGTFYNANRAAFTIPERRVIKYAVIGPEQAGAIAPPTEAEIAAVYRNSPRSYAARETRTLQSIVLPTQQAADAFAARVRGGTSFVAAAQQAGFAAADVTFADQTRDQFAGVSNPQVAAAAFAAAQGALVGPTRSELGFHVVRVDHVTNIAARPLESVRGEIAAAITARKRTQALAALVAQVEDQLSAGAAFEEVARAHNLTIVTTPPVTAAGQPVGGAPWTAPPELAALLHSAFDIDAENPEAAIETITADQRYAMLGIDRVVPAAPAPLEEIKPQVREALIQQRARQQTRALAERIVQRINAGTPAATAFAEAQPRIPAARPVNVRFLDLNQSQQQVPPALVALFRLAEGHAMIVPADNNAGWFVVVHEHRTPGDASTNTALITQLRNQFNNGISEELAQQFARAVELRGTVERDEEAIRRARAQMTGGATPAS